MLSTLASGFTLLAQEGSTDPEFRKVPFESWLSGGSQARIKWTARVAKPQLSEHQRLLTEVDAVIDGAELAKRSGPGEFLFLIQITASDGKRFQNHAGMDLDKVEEGIRKQDIQVQLPLFILPGDYQIAMAIFDTATAEHSVKQEKLHVEPLKDDPLPGMWRDLPAVEFAAPDERPDSWYLPQVTGRLHLEIAPQRPVDIELLVNLTPSERLSGSSRAQNRNLGALIPALKDVSHIDVRKGSLNVELLDLSRQLVTFHQENVHVLDWPAIKESLDAAKPGVIDVHSLEHRGQSAEFFVKEVARKLESGSGVARALIVLTSSVQFERGEKLQPISMTASPGCRVFYVRYRWRPKPRLAANPAAARPTPGYFPRFPRRGPAQADGGYVLTDQLEPLLKPLAPRLFEVETPEEFRKALAAILKDISQM